MDRENVGEWLHLQEVVIEILRASKQKGKTRVLQLLIIPSFTPTTCYNIYQTSARNQPKSYFGEFRQWQRDIDIEKFRTPLERLKYPRPIEPTFETKPFTITAETVKQIFDAFTAISIPAFVNINSLGLDGTEYEIELGDYLRWIRYHWWQQPPAEWESLHDAFQNTLQQLEKLAK